MEINYFQLIIFLIAVSVTVYFWYKFKLQFITNFLLGGLILIALSKLDFLGFKGKLDVLSFVFIIAAYIVLNISSLLTYMFKDYQQRFFFVFPVIFFSSLAVVLFCFVLLIRTNTMNINLGFYHVYFFLFFLYYITATMISLRVGNKYRRIMRICNFCL